MLITVNFVYLFPRFFRKDSHYQSHPRHSEAVRSRVATNTILRKGIYYLCGNQAVYDSIAFILIGCKALKETLDVSLKTAGIFVGRLLYKQDQESNSYNRI